MSNNKNDDLYVDDELTAAFMDEEVGQSTVDDPKEDNQNWVEDHQANIDGQLLVDMYETKSQLIVKCPVPGVNRKDIEVNLADNILTIRGSATVDSKTNVESYHIQECYWGEFSRSVSLPVAVVNEKIEATLTDGLLTIVFVKNLGESAQKIEIR